MTFKTFSIMAVLIGCCAAQAEGLEEWMLACRDLGTDEARLACYDAAVDRSRESTPVAQTAAPAMTDAAPAAATSATTPSATMADSTATAVTTSTVAAATSDPTDISQEELFGKDAREIERTVQQATGNERIDSLTAEVTRLQTYSYERVLITLDNGQVWKQVDSSRVRLRVGDTVTIERATLGSFLLQKKGSKRTMRVSRQD